MQNIEDINNFTEINNTWLKTLDQEQYLVGAKVDGIKTEFSFEKHKLPDNTDPVNFGLDFVQSQFPESLVEFDFIKIQ